MKALALLALVGVAEAAPPKPLPGTLYFVADGKLAKLVAGTVTGFDDVGAPVFPSPWALPDGRLVGIASKGNGEPGSEQLVLIGPGTKLERFGPAATQVRDPAVVDKAIVIEARFEPQSELYRIDLATQKSTRLTVNKQGNFTPAAIGSKAVAFASSRDGDSEIYRLDLASKKAKRLTAFHKDDWSPRVSPDGKTIAFLSDRTGIPKIFLVETDGTVLRRLTDDDSYEEDDPVWSPDGKSIAFVRTRVGEKAYRKRGQVDIGRAREYSALVVHEVAKAKQRVLTTKLDASEPAWSPDGQWIAITADAKDIVAVPIDGSAPVPVAKNARLPRWK